MATPYIPLEGDFTASIAGKGALTYDGAAAPSFATSTSFLYTLFFVAILVAASARYVIAGTHRMEASERGISKSNEIFKKTTIGLVGVFSLWLILSTINKDLLSGNVGLENLKTGYDGGASIVLSNPNGETMPSHTSNVDESAARSKVLNAGIKINKASCTSSQLNETAPSCTNLGGLPDETLNMLINLKNTCACDITITGGTEPGHQTHGVGLRPVDLRIESSDSPLYTFIKNKGSKYSTTLCNERWGWGGFLFWDEHPNMICGGAPGNRHFHVY